MSAGIIFGISDGLYAISSGNSKGGPGEQGFDTAVFRLFVVRTDGVVSSNIEIKPNVETIVDSLDPAQKYNLELYIIIDDVLYLVPGPAPVDTQMVGSTTIPVAPGSGPYGSKAKHVWL